jgi:DNA-binding transcriptional MerR regulator
MANDKLKATNKIAPFKTIKSQVDEIYKNQTKLGNKHPLVSKDIIKQLLMKGRSFKDLKEFLAFRQTKDLNWAKATDKYFQQKLGLLDDKWNPTSKNVIKEGPRARWRPLRNPAWLALTGGPVSEDQLRINKAHREHQDKEWKKIEKRSRRQNRLEDRRERGRQALKTGIAQGLAGPLLYSASDRYLSPLARQAGQYIGDNVLVPVGRTIDQLLIRKKKDGS